MWRLNWGIVDSPARFQPVRPPVDHPVTAATAGERAVAAGSSGRPCASSPRTEAVVFTIRTHITRLDRAIATRAAASGLASALRAMPPEMLHYKHIAPFAPELLAWLDGRA